MATILPSAISREPATNLNLNVNTGALIGNIHDRIPFIAVKSFLSKLTNGNIKFLQKEGYIDIADILANPPICNKLLYIVPNTDSDLVKSCLLCCFDVSMSQMVKESMNLFNIYQKAFVKPATTKILNVVRKPFVNVVVIHEFSNTNLQTTLTVSGEANKRLKEITKNTFELSTVTGVDNLNHTKLQKQSQKHLNDINQYLATQLSYSQIALNEGILMKCIQIAKAHCINRPLARVIHRYFESLWSQNMTSDDTRQRCLSKILTRMAEQTNAAIFELEHHPTTFLSDFVHEFLDSRIISEPLTKGSVFKINDKPVGGIIVMPPTSSSILNMFMKSDLKEGILESVKQIYFKPDDIFETPTDKDRVEILYKDGINTHRADTQNIKTENMLIGNKKEQSEVIVKLTEAGKQLLSTATNAQNNLMGTRKEYVIASVHFKKPVQYFEHLGKVYPIELLPFHGPGNSESQWIMNTEINHMEAVIWGGINKKSRFIESYASSLENNTIGNDKSLQNPHNLFSTKSVTVKNSTLESGNVVFGPHEALTVLTNPTRFSCKHVLESINVTANRVYQLFVEHTQFIQSYFNEINDTCINHRKLYTSFMRSLTIDGECLNKIAHDKLMRIEFKEFFTLYKNIDEEQHGKYTMMFRYLSGSVPWYVCGDEVSSVRGNKLIASVQNADHWKDIISKIKEAKSYVIDHPVFTVTGATFYDKECTVADRLSNSGFGNSYMKENSIDNNLLLEWYDDGISMIDKWEKEEDTVIKDSNDQITKTLIEIANGLMDAFSALFQAGFEHEFNYLFVKGNRKLTQWLFIANVILPVLSNAKMKFYRKEHGGKKYQYVNVNTNYESPIDSMILNDNTDVLLSYMLSCNVARMAIHPKYTMLHRMASIIMLFMYNTPYTIEQMVSQGMHTGFSVAYVKNEKKLAEDIMLLQPDSMELILGNGEIDNSEMTSDGSTNISLTCDLKYTQSTIGPVGLLAQCVYPKPSAIDESRDENGYVKISADIITRMYNDKYNAIADMAFSFNTKNKAIIERYMSGMMDTDSLPYLQKRCIKHDYVPIITPPIDLSERKFSILGLERCADFSESGGKSAYHSFFFTHNPSKTQNPYMSTLFSEGPVRYMKDTLMIDKNVPIKTYCLPKDVSNTGITTQQIEDMYNMMNDSALALTPQEHATFTNFEDQLNMNESVTSIPCLLFPDSRYYTYDHPDLRLGNAILSSQYTTDEPLARQIEQSRAYPGGDTKLDGTPFGFITRSPFTANRDRNPIMIDKL